VSDFRNPIVLRKVMAVPKKVDHEQRRRFIAAAVRRIAADRGLEAVSLGEVAVEAGISKGLVQHYFPSKDDMLRYATATLRDQVTRQLTGTVEGDTPSLRAVVVALLPLDAESRAEALVANAFTARALKDDEIAERFRVGHAELHESLAGMITHAQSEGALSADLDADLEADLLLALVAGLGDAVLLGHRTPEQATALIDLHLSRLAS
jgi:AcrR family transcriptional regulator